MKILFKILDYTISVLMGAGTVSVVYLLIGMEWNMFLAMFVGMLLGMVVLVLIVLIFSPVSTPFELFPVGMIITMFTGMGAGMVQTQGEADFTVMLVAAVLFSLSVQLVMDLFNMRLRGEVPIDR
jgi:hypothetical protein